MKINYNIFFKNVAFILFFFFSLFSFSKTSFAIQDMGSSGITLIQNTYNTSVIYNNGGDSTKYLRTCGIPPNFSPYESHCWSGIYSSGSAQDLTVGNGTMWSSQGANWNLNGDYYLVETYTATDGTTGNYWHLYFVPDYNPNGGSGYWTGHLYFSPYVPEDDNPDTVSWFASPDWSVENSNATTTSNPTFTFKYELSTAQFNFNAPFQACLYISNFSLASSTGKVAKYTKLCQPISQAGVGVFSTTTPLTNNTLYGYYGALESINVESTFDSIQSLTNRLQIGEAGSWTGIIPAGWALQGDMANSTSTSGEAFGEFLNIPNLLATKVPFGYIYQIGSILFSLGSSTATAQIPTGTMNWVLPISPTSSTTIPIDLFSTTTITHFLNPDVINLLRGIMVAIEWVGLAFYLWRRGHQIIH